MIRSSRIKVMLGLALITTLASLTVPTAAHAYDPSDFLTGAADAAAFNSQALQDWEATLSTSPVCQITTSYAGPLTQSTTTDVPPVHFGTQATDFGEVIGACGSPITESLVPPYVDVPVDYTMHLSIQFLEFAPWPGHPGAKHWVPIPETAATADCPITSASGQAIDTCQNLLIYPESDGSLPYLHSALFTITVNGVIKAQQQWPTSWSPRPQTVNI